MYPDICCVLSCVHQCISTSTRVPLGMAVDDDFWSFVFWSFWCCPFFVLKQAMVRHGALYTWSGHWRQITPLESESIPLECIRYLTSKYAVYHLKWIFYCLALARPMELKIGRHILQTNIFPTKKNPCLDTNFLMRYTPSNSEDLFRYFFKSRFYLKITQSKCAIKYILCKIPV